MSIDSTTGLIAFRDGVKYFLWAAAPAAKTITRGLLLEAARIPGLMALIFTFEIVTVVWHGIHSGAKLSARYRLPTAL